MTDKERDELLKRVDLGVQDLRADFAVLSGQNEDLRRTVYGNGQPGLAAEFIKVQQRQEECQKNNNKQVAKRANLIAAVAVTLMLATWILDKVL